MPYVQRWNERVAVHHAQSLRAQGGVEQKDFWAPLAASFHSDPRRTDDPVLERLARDVRPDWTVMDVGGGAGRYALPLALRCRHVTVVEPSESMVKALREAASDSGIHNLSIVQDQWEEARVGPADMVLCSHVLYGVPDVQRFVQKLDSHARRLVLVLLFMESPQSHLSPLWKRVHGEERIDLPGMRDLLPVLWELGIYPDLEMLEESDSPPFDSHDTALERLRQRLYVKPGTVADRRLAQAMEELLEETPNGFTVKGARPRRLALASWRRD